MIFNNSARNLRTHDVAAAYRLAKAEVRVQLPLGASLFAWMIDLVTDGRSAMNKYQRVGKLGIRVPWEHEIVGSNPTTLTET